MYLLLEALSTVGDLLFGVWTIFDWFGNAKDTSDKNDEEIDPNNSFQMGYLLGLKGGTITNAAIVQSALLRFEQAHGRKPTMRDAGVVVGLIDSTSAK